MVGKGHMNNSMTFLNLGVIRKFKVVKKYLMNYL